jgi:uncharacterized protein
VVDPALAVAAMRVNVDGVLRDGDLMGRILDTFVLTQLRAEAAVSDLRPRVYHLRAEQGRHDILLELAGGLVAFEVKADAAPSSKAAQHLRWLRDELGKRFVAGVVLHTGPRTFQMDDRISRIDLRSLELKSLNRP